MAALRIEPGHLVRIAYRIVDSDGRLLEEFTPERPYEYRHGEGNIVGPVERALAGKTAGFRAEIAVSPRDGFGDYDPGLVGELPRKNFPNSAEVAVGMKFNTVGPEGRQLTLRVIEVEGDVVTVDGNHPLAGLELVFTVQVLEVLADAQTQEHSNTEGDASAGTKSRIVH